MDHLEAIKQLKARYFRTMDTKDWEAMRQVFADDVVVDTTPSGGSVVQGADAFMAVLREVLGDVVSVHHGHMPEIELTSATTAKGIWAMQDHLTWPDGRELHGQGHYHETYELQDDAWRIKSLRLTRLRVDLTGPQDREVRQEVADLLVRYAAGIDRRDWELLRSCFTDDCVADYGDIGRWNGGDEITEWMRATHEPLGHTLHRITNQIVTVAADAANARSYVDAIVLGSDNVHGAQATGYYDDVVVPTDEGWRIARRRYTLVRVQPIGPGQGGSRPGGPSGGT